MQVPVRTALIGSPSSTKKPSVAKETGSLRKDMLKQMATNSGSALSMNLQRTLLSDSSAKGEDLSPSNLQ
jgi:hypothetical protein